MFGLRCACSAHIFGVEAVLLLVPGALLLVLEPRVANQKSHSKGVLQQLVIGLVLPWSFGRG